QTAPASPSQDTGGLSPQAVATLLSLQKVHDYPFYVMHYQGGYDFPHLTSSLPPAVDISCSLFASLNQAGDLFYGRNFDWEFSPSLLLFTDPPDGLASVSMVDLEFLGIEPGQAKNLADLPLSDRVSLLDAPAMPFDGMNESGLTIAMAAVPEQYVDDATFDASRPSIGSIGIIRLVLDHARDVDEAVDLFKQYNINFGGGPPIHYLIADRGRKAVLIEFYQSEMLVLTNEVPWHLATNHLRCIATGDGDCQRYRHLSERLDASNGWLDADGAMQLLSDVAQDSTQWSSVYNMHNGDVSVVVAQEYDQVFSFHLDLLQP
ncbi:MAG: carcinine hydrolase/isopenicillin-N N-acyltransferase family protein, partial [Acidobacteriaceae bacterium]